ncbi:flagellin A [Campylobacter hepaticus]|uniref:Flagellin n=6 Tax=Campylobacter hepaticus TaxID=1813019 RepID=A0A6A7JQU8_9BACT|nr:flagellin A [Campylobacter hepaticus]AXP08229.1 flagellin A [Campylobacter hepaticus]MCZ0772048.1 flagellin A [Campylobacter hepaticus]MCZ0773517.1 flagellin A [Campylobacter hepaticus]MCZ0774767.1 flagellin A [Campylobacter hepaticus]MPV61983.1 flagellin A [Campylobacter hepaticus]
MGFRINTNVAALNAKANSDLNAKNLDKSLERLSSGLRINSAADDASGMAIADSLRSQASTLGQAISNGNDALGILQTADKAMDEQLKILDTIKTKATQAAQDGQSLKTRTMLQADINRLMEQLDNIANTTEFNGKQLLSGGFINQEFQVGSSSNQTIKATIGATQSSKIGVTRFETGSQSFTSDKVDLVIKNYNGVDDFKFDSVIISTSVGTGLGALAEEINKNADKTGVRATYDVRTVGAYAIKEGKTSDTFGINGVTIGKVEYKNGDENGALVSAINSVKDTTGVEASRDENGRLVLTSRDGRGIKIEGDIGVSSGILNRQKENYGRLSLVKNDGRDINISGSGLSAIGMGNSDMISQTSVSLRESKGQIDANVADAMGFNSFNGGGKQIIVGYSSITAYMSSDGSGFSQGSGFSAMSTTLEKGVVVISALSSGSAVYTISAGSGFSEGSNNSQFARLKTSIGNAAGATKETAGVTTLKGAMAVMDIAQTAITNLDQIRADIGSVQNQLQVTINNITVTQVNVKSAESQIRDVDFASESANYSKANILAQSGSYAMAQANASQQNVLRLLQ